MRKHWVGMILFAMAVAAGRPAAAAAPDRAGRTQAALDDLARVCQEAEQRGEPTLYQRVPLIVGRLALVDLERADAGERAQVLDHIYERCLRAKIALLEAADDTRRRLDVAPAPSLAGLKLQGTSCVEGGKVVLPVVAGQAPPTARAFFSQGELARLVPALAGATPATVEQSEIFRIHTDDPTSRRVGWDRPAGGFVRGAGPDQTPVLISIDHPGMRDAIARETAKALEALAKEPRPLYLSLGGGHFYTDYSDLSFARFTQWLKERHKTLRVVNAVWDTSFQRFEPEMMPTPEQAAASPSRWADWVDFSQWRFTEHVRWACGNVRRGAPGVLLGMAPLRYAFAGSYGLSGVDPVAVAESVDVLELDGANAMEADLAATLAGGKRPVVETAMGPGAFGILPHQLHGAAAVRLAEWPQASLASLQGVLDAERALLEALDARRVAAACAVLSQAPRPVALLCSQASLRLAPPWALRCAETPYTRGLALAYEGARYLDVACRFLTSQDAARRDWGGARVVAVAGSPAEEDRVVRALTDYVELGGHLVVVAESLLTDERGREADYLMRLGLDVQGAARPVYRVVPRPERGGALDDSEAAEAPVCELHAQPGGPLASLKRPLRGVGVRQTIQVNVLHTVLATFPDGAPAIVTFPRGKGHVTYLAMPLESEDLTAVLRAVLEQAGVRPAARLITLDGKPFGIECRSVQHGSALLAYAWNTTQVPRRIAIEARASAALNLSTGLPLTVQSAGDLAVIGPLGLGPFETVLLRITLP